jgi:hypothetical protein
MSDTRTPEEIERDKRRGPNYEKNKRKAERKMIKAKKRK